MNDLITTAITMACDVTGSGAAWIELTSREGRQVLYGNAPRLPASVATQLMSARVDAELDLSTAVIASRQVEVVDRAEGARWSTGPSDMKEMRSVAAAPLQLAEKFVGTLFVSKEKAHAFDREDVIILTAVADQIALVIEQSRLIKSSIERERFEQEMLIARDLQQRLLPMILPESPFYTLYAESAPASIVGGDYYDVVSFSDQTLGLIIADVSGKGASAALYMGMIKGIIQALSGSCPTPRELLSRVNVALHGSIDNRWFATMTCAQIIEEQRLLRIARAGHCPTLVVRNGQASYSRSKGIGLAIAKSQLFDSTLELEEISFSSGDYAVFISDGLPEARSPDGEEFGYERLLEIVSCSAARGDAPEAMRNAVFAEISTFTAGEPSGDDSTVVIVRWS